MEILSRRTDRHIKHCPTPGEAPSVLAMVLHIHRSGQMKKRKSVISLTSRAMHFGLPRAWIAHSDTFDCKTKILCYGWMLFVSTNARWREEAAGEAMKKIYEQAASVIVWLGPSARGSDKAMDTRQAIVNLPADSWGIQLFILTNSETSWRLEDAYLVK